jgi:hypothetical protein
VRDPAWAAVVNADPELRQYVRNVKMSAEDQKARMRTVAAPIFAAQVGQLQLQLAALLLLQLMCMCHSTISGSRGAQVCQRQLQFAALLPLQLT